MAAESLVPLVAINDLATIVSKLMLAIPDTAKEPFSRNAVQGTLLQVRYYLLPSELLTSIVVNGTCWKSRIRLH